MSSVQIEGVRAIKSLEVPIEAGTVVVLSGPSGSGKSTALKAVAAGISLKSQGLLPTDGRESGAIRVPGVTVRIGHRMTSRGKATHNWIVVEDTHGIATLVDPDIQDPMSADKKRIETLLGMCNVGGSGDALRGFLGQQLSEMLQASLEKCEKLPLVDAVAQMKLALEVLARGAEADVQRLRGNLDAVGVIAEPKPVKTQKEIADLRADAQARTKTVIQLEAKRDAARAAAEELRDLTDEGADVIGELIQANSNVTDLTARSQELQRELDAVNKALDVATARRDAAKIAADAAELRAQKRKAAQQRLSESVTDEQVDAAIRERDAAEQAAELAAQEAKDEAAAAETRQKALTLRSKLDQTEANAILLRTSAQTVSNVLQEAVQQVGDFSVSLEGRLCVPHKRGVIPFAELSPGERTFRAIEVVARTVSCTEGFVPVIPLPQEALEAMSGNLRKKTVELADKKGICFVTAAVSTDEREEGIDVDVFRLNGDK
jgi:energy-coupling factor transporter ATP-binding protein EcfA2